MIAPAFSSCGCGEVHVGRIQSHVTWSELFSHRWRVCPSDKLIHAKHCFKYSFILGGVRIIIIWMVVSNIFYVHPYLGRIPILTNIFQVLWNHQLSNVWNYLPKTPGPLFAEPPKLSYSYHSGNWAPSLWLDPSIYGEDCESWVPPNCLERSAPIVKP